MTDKKFKETQKRARAERNKDKKTRPLSWKTYDEKRLRRPAESHQTQGVQHSATLLDKNNNPASTPPQQLEATLNELEKATGQKFFRANPKGYGLSTDRENEWTKNLIQNTIEETKTIHIKKECGVSRAFLKQACVESFESLSSVIIDGLQRDSAIASRIVFAEKKSKQDKKPMQMCNALEACLERVLLKRIMKHMKCKTQKISSDSRRQRTPTWLSWGLQTYFEMKRRNKNEKDRSCFSITVKHTITEYKETYRNATEKV